jgi:hypothetical protein
VQEKIFESEKHGTIKVRLDGGVLKFLFHCYPGAPLSAMTFKSREMNTEEIVQKAFDKQTAESAANIVTIAKSKLAN